MNPVRIFYSPAYSSSQYAFDTTRKSEWIADSLISSPIPGIVLAEPTPLSREQVEKVHSPEYVRAVETGKPRYWAESQGFCWDSKLWPMVLASNGGVVAAAHAALKDGVSGSLSSGLHHARYGTGAGFCTFNGLAIAAKEARASGAASVLILDLDAHCGGGTASLIEDDPGIRQLDVSTNFGDGYLGDGLAVIESCNDYIPAILEMLGRVEKESFSLCLYNAGMDPMEDCSLGGLPGITREVLAERERLVFQWCRDRKIPVAFVLAGGYSGDRLDEKGLVDLHRLTLAAASGGLS